MKNTIVSTKLECSDTPIVSVKGDQSAAIECESKPATVKTDDSTPPSVEIVL